MKEQRDKQRLFETIFLIYKRLKPPHKPTSFSQGLLEKFINKGAGFT